MIEEPDEDSPPIHIIPTYEDELAESTSNMDFPLSGAGSMYEEEKKTLEEKDIYPKYFDKFQERYEDEQCYNGDQIVHEQVLNHTLRHT